jgi:hypothetical protein
MKRSVLLAIISVLFLVPLSTFATTESTCKDVAIIFARGSGQNQTHDHLDELDSQNFKDDEPQSYQFFSEISSSLKNLSVEKIYINYWTM